MTNISLIENRISSAEKYLNILEQYKKYSREQIERDITIRGAVERYLYLAAQSVIDLAEGLVALRNLRKPASYGETFIILTEAGIISQEMSAEMIKMTGFRNIMAHGYEGIDFDIVYEVLQHRHEDIRRFLEAARKNCHQL